MTVSHERNGGSSDALGQLEDLLNAAIARIRGLVRADVERVRRCRPGLTQDQLARALVMRGTRRVGATSFATGFGDPPPLAVNVTSVLALQAATALAVAAAYDELDSADLRQDRVLILGSNSAVVALCGFGAAAGNDIGKRWVRANVTREP
jgi:hypothetical protein